MTHEGILMKVTCLNAKPVLQLVLLYKLKPLRKQCSNPCFYTNGGILPLGLTITQKKYRSSYFNSIQAIRSPVYPCLDDIYCSMYSVHALHGILHSVINSVNARCVFGPFAFHIFLPCFSSVLAHNSYLSFPS